MDSWTEEFEREETARHRCARAPYQNVRDYSAAQIQRQVDWEILSFFRRWGTDREGT